MSRPTKSAPVAGEALQLPSDRDGSGRDLGDEELALLAEVVRSGRLNAATGSCTQRFEREFGALTGIPHVIACNSGSTAVHAALATLRLRAGDEVVTTPVTDMGAILPILYEGAIPQFADVDAATGNVTAASIAAALRPSTRAVIATHLFGAPCEIDAIAALCHDRGVVLIEDCAQAYLSEHQGRLAGTFGDLACWSLQQGKQLTAGEGGIVASRDATIAKQARLFVHKGWDYGSAAPDHRRVGINGRWTELQAAVALAQLGKLPRMIAQRRAMADRLRALLHDLPAISLPPPAGHSYWRFALQVDPEQIRGGATALGAALQARGIAAQPHYVRQPAFACELFRCWRDEPRLYEPYAAAGTPPPDPDAGFPGVRAFLAGVVVLPWNERLQPVHIDAVGHAIRACCAELA